MNIDANIEAVLTHKEVNFVIIETSPGRGVRNALLDLFPSAEVVDLYVSAAMHLDEVLNTSVNKVIIIEVNDMFESVPLKNVWYDEKIEMLVKYATDIDKMRSLGNKVIIKSFTALPEVMRSRADLVIMH